jgi:hypothetical protein
VLKRYDMRTMMLSHNKTNDAIDTKKCEYRGVFNTTYDQLVKVFGEPLKGDLYRSDVEWHIQLTIDEANTYPVKIYNYKNGKSFLGEDGMKVEDIDVWSVASGGVDALPILKRRRTLKIK